MQYYFAIFFFSILLCGEVSCLPPINCPTTRVVFNQSILIIPTSASWLLVGANNALADWVCLFSHHNTGSYPVNVNNGNSVVTSSNPSNLMVVGFSRALSRLQPCNIPIAGIYLSFWVSYLLIESEFLASQRFTYRCKSVPSYSRFTCRSLSHIVKSTW